MFKWKKTRSIINPKHCTLLSENLGEKVIKVTLQPDEKNGETARAILFVTPDGFVREHSHAQDKNPDSEVYINLFEIARNGAKNFTVQPEIAGSNSPTGKTEHSIAKSSRPQVYLAIKKSQTAGAWNEFNRGVGDYLRMSHFGCSFCGNALNIVSHGSGQHNEFVVLDFDTNEVKYLSSNQKNEAKNETTSLAELLKPQKDFGREM